MEHGRWVFPAMSSSWVPQQQALVMLQDSLGLQNKQTKCNACFVNSRLQFLWTKCIGLLWFSLSETLPNFSCISRVIFPVRSSPGCQPIFFPRILETKYFWNAFPYPFYWELNSFHDKQRKIKSLYEMKTKHNDYAHFCT